MRIPTWAKFFLVAAIIVVIGAWILDYFEQAERDPKFPSYIHADHTETVLVIDLSANGELSHRAILSGDDGVLVVHVGNDPKQHAQDIILNQALLAQLDQNHDGVIDIHDPIYNRLELIFIDQDTKRAKIISLAQAGIRGLYPDTEHLPSNLKIKPSSLHYIAGSAVMSDGSIRLIRDIIRYQLLPRRTSQQQIQTKLPFTPTLPPLVPTQAPVTPAQPLQPATPPPAISRQPLQPASMPSIPTSTPTQTPAIPSIPLQLQTLPTK